jgi:outer membrane lipoprotein-sorting protein
MNRTILALLMSALVLSWQPQAGAAANLDEVLKAMDVAGTGFRDMTANISQTDYTAVIKDTTQESGKVVMKKAAGAEIRMLVEFTGTDPRTVAFAGAKVEMYYPKIQTVQVYDLGKYTKLVEQFLLLGFGGSVGELKKNYVLKLLGAEQVHGEATTRLELTPKSAEARQHLAKVELWVNGKGYPLRQKFNFPSGDFKQVTYMDLHLNAGVADAAVALAVPAGVKRVYPDK